MAFSRRFSILVIEYDRGLEEGLEEGWGGWEGREEEEEEDEEDEVTIVGDERSGEKSLFDK